ncbi:MAG: phage tail tape measure protein, partial [Pseudomonadota bacterium]
VRKTLLGQTEVLDIEYALNSAGLSESVARSGTEIVHKLAKITRGMPDQVGEIFGVTFNNMGGAIEGSASEVMGKIANVLAKTQFKFQIRDFGQLGESMKYAAAAASSAKVPLAQTAAVIGQLNTAGLQGSMAGTAFEAMLRKLGDAGDELGFEIIRDPKGEMDLIATLGKLRGALDGLDTDERATMLQDMFGDAGKRAIVPLLDQLGTLKAAYRDVADAANSDLVNEEYGHFLNSSSGQLQRFRNNMSLLGNQLAVAVLPRLNDLAKALVSFGNGVSALLERFPRFGEWLGLIVTGFMGVGAGVAIVNSAAWMIAKFMKAAHFLHIAGAVAKLKGALMLLGAKAFPLIIAGVRAIG